MPCVPIFWLAGRPLLLAIAVVRVRGVKDPDLAAAFHISFRAHRPSRGLVLVCKLRYLLPLPLPHRIINHQSVLRAEIFPVVPSRHPAVARGAPFHMALEPPFPTQPPRRRSESVTHSRAALLLPSTATITLHSVCFCAAAWIASTSCNASASAASGLSSKCRIPIFMLDEHAPIFMLKDRAPSSDLGPLESDANSPEEKRKSRHRHCCGRAPYTYFTV